MTTNDQVLARYARSTEVITAEHHPVNHGGMPYVLHIVGGKHSGTRIYCTTEASVNKLFDDIVAARKAEAEHPYLVEV
jgi:hypothetical protein